MNKFICLQAIVTILLLTSCQTQKVVTPALQSYSTECLGVNMDGNQTLRAWASGKNRTNAIKQAKKKAVYDVVFTGIQAGNGTCNAYPIVDEANARQKYEDYFDQFFSDNGDYTRYVSRINRRKSTIQIYQGNGTKTAGVIVTVNRSALRQHFVKDNIIVK
ncbi:MAG: hypothetical protein IIV54_02585 [Bacteroidaceae bacterium]|nr:hypothetical protein [Bacteroidaceae bacterium]